MKETRTEYLARIAAEHPGAYHRIDDLMRSWDREHAEEMSSEDAAEAVAHEGGPRIVLPNPENASPEGGEPEPAAPAIQPEEPASASPDANEQEQP